MAASNLRPADKTIVEPTGRLKLEWDAYFSRLEAKIAEIADAVQSGGAPSNRNLIAGDGLTGGGDLSADRTFNVGEGTGITVSPDAVSTNDAEIVHDNLSGFVPNEHIDHTGVTLTAGAGLTGGGDISANRTFTVGAGTGITVNADDVAITAGGVGTTQLADGGVTFAKLQDISAYTLVLRNAGTSGDAADVKISALTDAGAFGSGDKLMIEESTGELRKIDYDDLPGAGGSSDFVLLDSGTVSSAATLDIVLTSHTAYKTLMFVLEGFLPVTDDVQFWMRFSSDGGSSYDATGYSYAAIGPSDNVSASAIGSAAANQILLAGFNSSTFDVSNAAAEGGVDATIQLFGRTSTARWSRITYDSIFSYSATPSTTRFCGVASREAAQDTDAVRFLFETGNIASGNWALYGLA